MKLIKQRRLDFVMHNCVHSDRAANVVAAIDHDGKPTHYAIFLPAKLVEKIGTVLNGEMGRLDVDTSDFE